MSTYNNNRFTPGNKSNLRQFMNKEIIRQYYRTFNSNHSFVNCYHYQKKYYLKYLIIKYFVLILLLIIRTGYYLIY